MKDQELFMSRWQKRKKWRKVLVFSSILFFVAFVVILINYDWVLFGHISASLVSYFILPAIIVQLLLIFIFSQCPRCGHWPGLKGLIFCRNCGLRLEDEEKL